MISRRTINTIQDYIVSDLNKREIERLFEDNGIRKFPGCRIKTKRELFNSYLQTFETFSTDETKLAFVAEAVEKIYEASNFVVYPSGHIGEKKRKELLDLLKKDGFSFLDGKLFISQVLHFSNQIKVQEQIKRFLNTDYISSKIKLMNRALDSESDLAIGTAKELIETICKSILKKYLITPDKEWDLGRLLKETNKWLCFKPKEVENPENAERSVKQILGGISAIIQGIAELRNAYGTGHGKVADFRPLEASYAKLVVGLASELAIFYLHVNGEGTELMGE